MKEKLIVFTFLTIFSLITTPIIKNNSQIITKRDSIHYDQIKGEEIDGFFENNELKVLDVNVNSEAIYYLALIHI